MVLAVTVVDTAELVSVGVVRVVMLEFAPPSMINCAIETPTTHFPALLACVCVPLSSGTTRISMLALCPALKPNAVNSLLRLKVVVFQVLLKPLRKPTHTQFAGVSVAVVNFTYTPSHSEPALPIA